MIALSAGYSRTSFVTGPWGPGTSSCDTMPIGREAVDHVEATVTVHVDELPPDLVDVAIGADDRRRRLVHRVREAPLRQIALLDRCARRAGRRGQPAADAEGHPAADARRLVRRP